MKLFADYRQIHVAAADAKGDLADAWTAKATDDRIAAAGDIVGIGTEAADDIDVTVEVLAREPAQTKGDHVTEASITLGTKVAVLGCTDFRPEAKTYTVTPGTWRLRATHTNIAKRERIKLQLWPTPRATRPKVLTRWKAPKQVATPRPKGRPKNHQQAVVAAREGRIDVALEKLLELHASGDAAASASAAEILAFQGRWDEMVPCAKALLKNPGAVYAGNVIDDMKDLLKAKKSPPKPGPRARPNRKTFDEAVAEAPTGKRFKGKPRELARHCFWLAVVFNVDDEIIKRWDPKHPSMHFDAAVEVARALVRKKDPNGAWKVLESRLGRWYPVDGAQVLPVVLLTDPLLAPLMTKERTEQVLRTPRAV